ncbi:efflux RND transporter periplasmic adaptor subunit [Mucisphaera sp.]|uniref:efflux RND transporter periplasmic adaptor subunit n=1 Tax=Mucisphaera sp. TaxID=2913024 RepID=UPI003D0ED736
MTSSKEKLKIPISTITRVVVAALVLAAGLGIMSLLIAARTEAARVDPNRDRLNVPAFHLQPVTVRRPWQGYGRAVAVSRANIPARVVSAVAEIPEGIDAGTPVSRNQTIIRLDARDFLQQVDAEQREIERLSAEIDRLAVEERRLTERLELLDEDLAIAIRQEDRLRDLSERRAANVADVERAERETLLLRREHLTAAESLEGLPARRAALQASAAAARARLALLNLSVERSNVVSPIDGVLATFDLDVGESVTAGQTLAEVVDLTRIEVPIQLPASARGRFAVGDQARIVSASDPSRSWIGRIDRINPTDDPQTRTLTAYALVEQPDAQPGDADTLSPGLFVAVEVLGSPTPNVLAVPRRAVRAGRLYVINDGQLESRAVTVRYTLQQPPIDLGIPEWVVLDHASNLQADDLIVAEATTLLRDGLAVEPRTLQTTTAAAIDDEVGGTP